MNIRQKECLLIIKVVRPCGRVFHPTRVVGECASVAVKDKPAFLPGFDLASHLDQVASAGLLRHGQVEACVCAVARWLNVSAQVKVVLPHGQVPSQWPWLEGEKWAGQWENAFVWNNNSHVLRVTLFVLEFKQMHFIRWGTSKRVFILQPAVEKQNWRAWPLFFRNEKGKDHEDGGY